MPEIVVSQSTGSSGGGCSLGGRAATSSVGGLFFMILALGVLVLQRENRRRGTASLVIALSMLAVGCGGASATSGVTSVDFDQTATMSQSSLTIDTEKMMVNLKMWNDDASTRMVLMIPLKHYFPDEAVELGVENLVGTNFDQAILVVAQYESSEGNAATGSGLPRAAWVSTSGSLTVDWAPVNRSGVFLAHLENVELTRADLATGLPDRDGETIAYSMTASGTLAEGEISAPFVIDASVPSGGIGSKVQLRGFNFESNTRVWFEGCGNNFDENFYLSTRVISRNLLEVKISGYCPDSRLKVATLAGVADGLVPSVVFDASPPLVTQPLPQPETNLLKSEFDAANGLVYLLFKSHQQLEVYSTTTKEFLTPIPLPIMAENMALTADGSLMISKGKDLMLLAADASIAKQIAIPKGDVVADIVSGPGTTALIAVDYNIKGNLLNLCAWDIAGNTISCPPELTLLPVFDYKPWLTIRPDRQVALVRYQNGSTAVFRLDSLGNVQKMSNVQMSSAGVGRYFTIHPLRDEIWIGENIYDFNLVLQRQLHNLSVVGSNDGTRYYWGSECEIRIATDDDAQDPLSFFSCAEVGDAYGIGKQMKAYLSNDENAMIVIWNDKIRQFDLGQINAYLSSESE